jgi:hypothetical protein
MLAALLSGIRADAVEVQTGRPAGECWKGGFLFHEEAIAARNFLNSALSMAMKRNGWRPIGVARHGLSSSAMASTGPICVDNISSTTAPELRGLSTRSNPPVTETSWSLAEEYRPSPNRRVAGGMPGSRTRTGRRVRGDWGEDMWGNIYRTDKRGEITKERVRTPNAETVSPSWPASAATA